jgi:menaquinone-9 beta-reductase
LRDRALRPFALPAPAWGISRYTFDARLAAAFVAAGGDLRSETRVPENATPPGRVFAVGRKRAGPFWVGLKIHVHDLELVNEFEVHLGDRAYLGLSRIETGAVNVCGIFAHRPVAARGAELLPAYLAAAGLGQLALRLRQARPDPATFCVTAASLGDPRVLASDRVRIGDACATIPPFTGNGLAMALQGAALAVEPLRAFAHHETGWDEAARRIATTQRKRFRRRLMLASILHPFFLETGKQRLLAGIFGSGLVPFRAVYAALH